MNILYNTLLNQEVPKTILAEFAKCVSPVRHDQ
jgi:hypothetical protein